MMEETTLFNNQQQDNSINRSQFLTVFCILSILGCCLSVVWNIYEYYSITVSEVSLANMVKGEGNTYGLLIGIQDVIKKAIDNALLNLIIGVLFSSICFYGVLMMWKLKKIGFFIYSLGEITPAIISFFLIGSGPIAAFFVVTRLIVSIVWVVLFATNFKNLNN